MTNEIIKSTEDTEGSWLFVYWEEVNMGKTWITMQLNYFQDKFKIRTLLVIKRMSKRSHSIMEQSKQNHAVTSNTFVLPETSFLSNKYLPFLTCHALDMQWMHCTYFCSVNKKLNTVHWKKKKSN